MTQETHSPLPWHIDEIGTQAFIIDGNGDPVLVTSLSSVTNDQILSKNAARLAVAAVNCHKELVEALEHARNQIQHPDQLIDEALSRAKEAGR